MDLSTRLWASACPVHGTLIGNLLAVRARRHFDFDRHSDLRGSAIAPSGRFCKPMMKRWPFRSHGIHSEFDALFIFLPSARRCIFRNRNSGCGGVGDSDTSSVVGAASRYGSEALVIAQR